MFRGYLKYRKRVIGYFKNHVEYNAAVHTLGGIGIGILIASPLADTHPIRWGLIFLGLSLLGHVYALGAKK